jgi:hypothetical protein
MLFARTPPLYPRRNAVSRSGAELRERQSSVIVDLSESIFP